MRLLLLLKSGVTLDIETDDVQPEGSESGLFPSDIVNRENGYVPLGGRLYVGGFGPAYPAPPGRVDLRCGEVAAVLTPEVQP